MKQYTTSATFSNVSESVCLLELQIEKDEQDTQQTFRQADERMEVCVFHQRNKILGVFWACQNGCQLKSGKFLIRAWTWLSFIKLMSAWKTSNSTSESTISCFLACQNRCQLCRGCWLFVEVAVVFFYVEKVVAISFLKSGDLLLLMKKRLL
jgi:hypothetical protein